MEERKESRFLWGNGRFGLFFTLRIKQDGSGDRDGCMERVQYNDNDDKWGAYR